MELFLLPISSKNWKFHWFRLSSITREKKWSLIGSKKSSKFRGFWVKTCWLALTFTPIFRTQVQTICLLVLHTIDSMIQGEMSLTWRISAQIVCNCFLQSFRSICWCDRNFIRSRSQRNSQSVELRQRRHHWSFQFLKYTPWQPGGKYHKCDFEDLRLVDLPRHD